MICNKNIAAEKAAQKRERLIRLITHFTFHSKFYPS